MQKLIKRVDEISYMEFLGTDITWALNNGYIYEEIPEDIDKLKETQLAILKCDIESYIYDKYPLYKQNNIAIFGTEEEKEEFKLFHNNIVNKYDELVEIINQSNSAEEIKSIKIEFNI